MLPKRSSKLGEYDILSALFDEEEEAIEMASTSASEGTMYIFTLNLLLVGDLQ
jgi:hypothetical protein